MIQLSLTDLNKYKWILYIFGFVLGVIYVYVAIYRMLYGIGVESFIGFVQFFVLCLFLNVIDAGGSIDPEPYHLKSSILSKRSIPKKKRKKRKRG